jgi:flagellar P-ring protein precursor FlgI
MVPFLLLSSLLVSTPAEAARVKEVASLYGMRENLVTGFGVVAGLNKTGDSSQNTGTLHALAARFQPLGVLLSDEDIKSRNVALVMITANIPAGARPGSKLDVTVMSTGDARSLEGGVLLYSLLYAGQTAYASAAGPLIVGGYSASGGGNEKVKNHPTVGIVTLGGTLEKEIPNALQIGEQVDFQWILNVPDFTNSARMASVVNALLGPDSAAAVDAGTVRVRVPDAWLGRQTELVAAIEALDIPLDHTMKVVVNERTGTVVMGADIPLSPVAIAHGGLTIDVSRRTEVSQPGMLASGETAVIANTEVRVREEAGKVSVLRGATVGDVVSALNAMGVSPRDLIVILQSMQRAGGISAQVESM